MIRPEALTGHTRCGRYAIRSYRGPGCAGWVYVADQTAQNPCAGLSGAFGGGGVPGQTSTRVILEIVPNGRDVDQGELQHLQTLYPHNHLLRFLDAGQSHDEGLTGAVYVATEVWRDTLAQVLAKRSRLEEEEVRNIAVGVAAALARYHSDNRVHGDVRSERICQVDGHWKLAPVLHRKANDKKADKARLPIPQDDIYALGLVLLESLSPRFASLREKATQHSLNQAEIAQALRDLPEFWRHWLGRCLAADPCQRCSAAELALMDARIPSPVTEVLVDREGDQYRLHWQPVADGNVQVYRWLRGRCPAQGEIWLRADLDRIADKLPLTLDAGTRVPSQPGPAWQIIVVSIAGEAAVIGDSITLTCAADVEGLKLTIEGKSVVASWDWPAAAPVVQVMVREGAFPTGPDDPQAANEQCFRPGYLADGGRCVIPINPQAGVIHVAVYAKYPREEGWDCASGRTTGARATLVVAQNIHLHYRVEKVSLLARIFLKMQPWRLSMRADRTATLPELTLVAGESGTPSYVDGGVPVLQIPSQQYAEGTVVQREFCPPEGVRIENTWLLARGKPNNGVRLIPEHGRLSKLVG